MLEKSAKMLILECCNSGPAFDSYLNRGNILCEVPPSLIYNSEWSFIPHKTILLLFFIGQFIPSFGVYS